MGARHGQCGVEVVLGHRRDADAREHADVQGAGQRAEFHLELDPLPVELALQPRALEPQGEVLRVLVTVIARQ